MTKNTLIINNSKKLEEQLQQSQKMEVICQLAGGVAHDLNNILTAIIGLGAMAQRRLKDDATTWEFIQEMLDGAKRAAELTQHLLSFSKKQIISPKPQDLNSIVIIMEKTLRGIIGEDIELRLALSSRDIMVIVDTAQINHVLLKLVAHARDTMPDGGHLIIETDVVNIDKSYAEAHFFENAGRYAVLTVSVTGRRIFTNTKNRIFEPFFTIKETEKVTSLGLAIVYGLIKQNGGNIDVYSELGKGTAFRIYLPVTQPDVEEKPETTQPQTLGKGKKSGYTDSHS